MPKREKFGKFVLLEEVEASGLGTEYRAAKLNAGGLDKIVTVLRGRPDLTANEETVKSLMDQVKFAAQLQNPTIVKLYVDLLNTLERAEPLKVVSTPKKPPQYLTNRS